HRCSESVLALGEVGFLGGQLCRAIAELLPECSNAGAAFFQFGGALLGRLLPTTLTLSERLPGSLQVPLLVGHCLQFSLRARLPFYGLAPSGACHNNRFWDSALRGQSLLYPSAADKGRLRENVFRRGAGAVERGGLENRWRPKGRPWVQIPPPPLAIHPHAAAGVRRLPPAKPQFSPLCLFFAALIHPQLSHLVISVARGLK